MDSDQDPVVSVIRPKSFVEELMDIIVIESNNGDYYVDGYVSTGPLVDLINKWFPEYEFNPDWNYSHWQPRDPNAKHLKLIQDIYNQQFVDQLTQDTNILKGFALIRPQPMPKVGDTVTFTIKPTTFKKDDES